MDASATWEWSDIHAALVFVRLCALHPTADPYKSKDVQREAVQHKSRAEWLDRLANTAGRCLFSALRLQLTVLCSQIDKQGSGLKPLKELDAATKTAT